MKSHPDEGVLEEVGEIRPAPGTCITVQEDKETTKLIIVYDPEFDGNLKIIESELTPWTVSASSTVQVSSYA